MPISSKNIIKHLSNIKGPFTKRNLINDLIESKLDRQKNKSGNKKKKSYKPAKDLSRLDSVIEALTHAELLYKEKKKYSVANKLSVRGKILINTSGNGIVATEDQDEFFVRKEYVNHAHNNDMVTIRINDFRKGLFYGEVVQINSRNRDRYVAKISKKTKGLVYLSPVDMPGDIEFVCEREKIDESGDNFYIVSIEDKFIANKQSCIVEKIFNRDDETADFERISIKHSLPEDHPEYPELKDIESTLHPDELKNRKDYRKFFTVTIDGEDAKDFDDAISIKKSGKNTKLIVHIADVSAYVRKDSPLDMEALKRGTSYYIGNTVIPMLPETLSNDLCSLKKGTDRLTMSVEMTFSPEGEVSDCIFTRGLINVNKRLTYNSSSEIMEKGSPAKIAEKLNLMNELAFILKKKRLKEGRLDLNLPDEEIVYENNHVKEIKFARRLKTHMIVEECMLSANEAVSRYIKENSIPSLYRVHEKISREKLTALIKFMQVMNIKLKKSAKTGPDIQNILEKIAGHRFEQVVNLVILKSLMQAYYGTEPLGHFGLGFEDYTHFTSPIRRYPDLIVHRCLKSIIDRSIPQYSTAELDFIGEKTSEMERIAQKAERGMTRLKSCRILKNRVGEKFSGVISGVAKFGFFVALTEMPIEGMVPLRFLTNDYYLVKEDEYTVIGRKYGKRFRLGDKIRVKLIDVEIETMRIDFNLA